MMCGIIGLVVSETSNIPRNTIQDIVGRLFSLSESRGNEATGMAIRTNNHLDVYKSPVPASSFINTKKYRDIITESLKQKSYETDRHLWALIGHSRLSTNGSKSCNYNNQPVIIDRITCVHNGEFFD